LIRPEDLGLEPLADECIPDSPPFPGIELGEALRGHADNVLADIQLPAYLSYDLLRAAYRLAELSEAREGRYRDGLDIPESSRAAATGAIAVACAAFEAALNDLRVIVDVAEDSQKLSPTAQLLRLAVKLSPEPRFEAIAAMCGHRIDWGLEPYQSLQQLFSVRKYLLHHEGRLFQAAEGFWPAKRLRDIARKIRSPYAIDAKPPLGWQQHILTPAGGRWAVSTVATLMEIVQDFEREIEERVRSESSIRPSVA